MPAHDELSRLRALSAADLHRCLEALLPVLGALPRIALPPHRRRTIGGTLTPEAALLCREVSRTLLAEPPLFADLAADPGALLALQERADAWRLLRDALTLFARVAADGYLLDQAAALERARAVIAEVRRDGDDRRRHARHFHRAHALSVASLILQRRYRRKGRRDPRAGR